LIAGIKIMKRTKHLKSNPEFSKILKSSAALRGVNYVVLVSLVITKRRLTVDQQIVDQILADKSINSEKKSGKQIIIKNIISGLIMMKLNLN
jgi:hypothetical protein